MLRSVRNFFLACIQAVVAPEFTLTGASFLDVGLDNASGSAEPEARSATVGGRRPSWGRVQVGLAPSRDGKIWILSCKILHSVAFGDHGFARVNKG
jgi:hypothetical protein